MIWLMMIAIYLTDLENAIIFLVMILLVDILILVGISLYYM